MKTNSLRGVAISAVACLFLAGCAKQPVVKGPIPAGDYTVLDDEDDLNNISLRAYGNRKYWRALLNANPELCQRPGFDLVPGETLKIPAQADLDMKHPQSVFPKQLPADYIVLPGDSLPSIAKGCYGDKGLWTIIYDANRSTLSSKVRENPNMLIAGQVLHIPAKPTASTRAPSGASEQQQPK